MAAAPGRRPLRYARNGRLCAAVVPDGIPLFLRRRSGGRRLPRPDGMVGAVAPVQRHAAHRHGRAAGPHFGDDAGGDNDRFADGPYLQFRLHEGRAGVSALLCLPVALQLLDARTGRGYQHFPDVYFLGTRGGFLVSAYRFLLYEARCDSRLQKGLHRDAVRRPGLSNRHSYPFVLYGYVRFRTADGRQCFPGGDLPGGRFVPRPFGRNVGDGAPLYGGGR